MTNLFEGSGARKPGGDWRSGDLGRGRVELRIRPGSEGRVFEAGRLFPSLLSSASAGRDLRDGASHFARRGLVGRGVPTMASETLRIWPRSSAGSKECGRIRGVPSLASLPPRKSQNSPLNRAAGKAASGMKLCALGRREPVRRTSPDGLRDQTVEPIACTCRGTAVSGVRRSFDLPASSLGAARVWEREMICGRSPGDGLLGEACERGEAPMAGETLRICPGPLGPGGIERVGPNSG